MGGFLGKKLGEKLVQENKGPLYANLFWRPKALISRGPWNFVFTNKPRISPE
jgi:hypothetical protein